MKRMEMSNQFQLCFKSTLFDIVPGEDADTNPGRYGKSLANWLREKLIAMGYSVEDIVPEDWGWCVMCQRYPFRLWVGCGNTVDDQKVPLETSSESERSITWTCFVQAEASLFARFFQKIDTRAPARKLYEAVKSILTNEPGIIIVS
jgi:hypothetical protein